MEKPFSTCISLLLIYLFTLPVFAGTQILNEAIDNRVKAQAAAIKSQHRVDSLAEETRSIVQVYRDTIRKSDSLQTYNQQLSRLIKNQQESLDSIERQIENAEETQRNLLPLLVKMIATLEQFVSLDLPFLVTERQQRIQLLNSMMERPDVTMPDKYRRIMEAYLIELEYGRTIETYNETIMVDHQQYTVDVLRVGRISLTFQTPDGEISGVWNKATGAWQILDDDYRRSLKQGLRIANKQAPPELVKLPIQVMK